MQVNGEPASDPADRADPHHVLVDGAPVEGTDGLLVAFHKPAGHVCTHAPDEGPTIYELLPPRWLQRNPPVTSIGRLDQDATGLLLLTDAGELVHRWTSPRHKMPKLYEVTVATDLRPELIPRFAAGTLMLDSETTPCLPARLEILSAREARLELTEGRYHQVKRMFASQGCPVTRLHRTRFGDVELGDLPAGQWRALPLPDLH